MNKKKKNNIKFAIIILCCIALGVGTFFLFQEKTTNTSVKKDLDSVSPIICKSSNPSFESFFEDGANSSTYTIKYTFKNGKADKISFTYNGKYASAEDAEYANASAHASYNIFMSKTSKDSGVFSPSFSNTDSSMQINLFGDVKDLTSLTAGIFYIDADTFKKIDFTSLDEVVKNYENKNFSCTFNK